jgi:hypothetical protein
MKSLRTKFLDPKTIDEAIAEIALRAKRQGTKVALVGGAALQHFGSTRMTVDIDVIADDTLDDMPVGKPLTFGGEQTKAINGAPVDIIVRDDDYKRLYQSAIATATTMPGVPIPVARPEYIAAMKFAAGRRKDEDDLEFLILNNVIDVKETEKIIYNHVGGQFAKEQFSAFVESTRWMASKNT